MKRIKYLILSVMLFATHNLSLAAGLTGTIQGPTSVCLNTNSVKITFTGSGGSGAPYTFYYRLNKGAVQTIKTSGTENTTTVQVPTDKVGTLEYSLDSISDKTNKVIAQSVIANVTVNGLPTVDFNFLNNQCSGIGVQFNANVSGASPFTYFWDFGDGNSSNIQNPIHSFESVGCGSVTFKVKLIVTDANGCSSTIIKDITIVQKPDIAFEDVNATSASNQFSNCKNASASNPEYSIEVGNSSSSTCITSYSINWGDGNVQSNISFPLVHTYTKLGAYNMLVTAIGSNGCSNTKTYLVKNVSNPSGGIISPGNTQNLCAPTDKLQFEISKWGANSPGTIYTIDYDDGTIVNLTQEQMVSSTYYNTSKPEESLNYPVPHSYTKSSCPSTQFTITLSVSNACGSTTGTISNISVLTKPEANFSATSKACVNTSVSFTNTTKQGYDTDCSLSTKFTWDFGDSTPIQSSGWTNSTPGIIHNYTTPGIYTVTLTAQNGCGSTTKTQQVCIEPSISPLFDLNTTEGCIPLKVITINTTDLSKACSTPSYTWTITGAGSNSSYTFLDNTTTSSASPSIQFNAPGTYTLQLTATGACGSQSVSKTIVVKAPPTATLAPITNLCQTGTSTVVTPSATVLNNTTQPVTYNWSFPGGTPTSSTSTTPGTITYPTSGAYTYSLTVTNECGATTSTKTFTINPTPILNDIVSQVKCAGTNSDVVTFSSNLSGTTYTWTNNNTSIGIPVTGSGSTLSAYPLTNTGITPLTAIITVTPTSPLGCNGDSKTFTIQVQPTPSVNSVNNITLCSGTSQNEIPFSSSVSGMTYNWSSSNATDIGLPSNSGTGNIPAFTATNKGNAPVTATFKVTPSSISGCAGTSIFFTITVNPTPAPLILADKEYCNGEAVSLSGFTSNVSGTTYHWTNSNTSIGLKASGDGNIPQFTATNLTANPITATIKVIQTANGCSTPSQSFNITINPAAAITFSPENQIICSGEQTLPVTLSSSTPNVSFHWAATVPLGITGAATTGAIATIPVQTLINTTNTPLSVTYKATASMSGSVSCPGAEYVYSITVNPKPVVAETFATTICSGDNFSINPVQGVNGNNIPAGIIYTWPDPLIIPSNALTGAVAQSTPVSTIGQTLTNVANVKATATYTVTPVANGCSGNPFTVTVSVNPQPQINDVSNKVVCVGDSVVVDFSTTNTDGTTRYNWTNNNSSIGFPGSGSGRISFVSNNTGATPLIGTITVTPVYTNGNKDCKGAVKQFTITVNPIPKIRDIVTGMCGNGSFSVIPENSISDIVPAGTKYSWSLPVVTGGITGGAEGKDQTCISGNLNNTTDQLQTAIYTVTPVYGICTGSPFKVTVNLSPKPIVEQEYVTICSGNFNATPSNGGRNLVPNGTTYTWSAPVSSPAGAISGGSAQNTGVTSIGQDITNMTNAPATLTYTVTPNSSGCPGDPFKVIVTVNPTPKISSTVITICDGESFSFSPTNVNGDIIPTNTTYSWNDPVVTGGLTGGVSGAGETSIKGTLNNHGNEVHTATYKIASLSGAAGRCPGDSFLLTVKVNPVPSIKDKSKTMCSGSLFTIIPETGNGDLVPDNTTYIWNLPESVPTGAVIGGAAQSTGQNSISQLLTNTTNTPANLTYMVTPTAEGCQGAPFKVTVRVNPTPKVQNKTLSICSGETFTVSPVNDASTIIPVNTTYSWSIPVITGKITGGRSGNQESTITGTLINTSNVIQTATYTITPLSGDSGHCEGITFTLTVKVNPVPQISDKTTGVCGSGNFAVMPTNSGSDIVSQGTTYSWSAPEVTGGVTGGAAATGQISINGNLNNPTDQLQTAIYTVTPVSGSCTGTSFKVIVSLSPKPIISDQSIAICSGGFSVTPTNGSGNLIPNGTTYTWPAPESSPVGAIIGGSPQNTGVTSISQIITNTTNTPATLTYTVTPNSSGCIGESFKVAVIVNPTPNINSQTLNICSGESFAFTPRNDKGNIIPTNTTYSWSAPVVTGGLVGGVFGAGETFIRGTLINPTNEMQTAIYTVIPVSGVAGNCPGESFTLTVKVNPTPKFVETIRDTIYSEKTFLIIPRNGNGNIVPDGVTYTWTTPVVSPSGAIIGASAQSVPQKEISQTLTNNTYSSATVTYTVTPVANNCQGTPFEVVVRVNPLIYSNAKVTHIRCNGANDGSISTDIIGGVPFSTGAPYLISWTGPDNYSSTLSTITGLAPGNYHLTIKDADGLIFNQDFVVVEPAKIAIVPLIHKNITCNAANNGEIQISVTGGTGVYRFAWLKDGIAYSTDQNIKDLSPGNYTVSVTDTNNCGPVTYSYTITEPEPLKIELVKKANNLCAGDKNGSISVDVSGGTTMEMKTGVFDYLYKWTGPYGFTSDSKDIAELQSGTYQLSVTDKSGCNTQFSTDITEPDSIKVQVTTTPITCYGADNASIKLDIRGGVAPYKAEWDNWASGFYQDNLSAKDYVITITDANQCVKTVKVNIQEAPLFRISPVVKQISCHGANDGSIKLNIEGGQGKVILQWSDNSTSGNERNNIGPGTYTVTIRDDKPCEIIRTFIINEPQELNVSGIVTDALDCKNVNSGGIDLTVTGGTQPYSYLWSNNATTEDLTGAQAGNYFVTVTDVKGCSKTLNYTVKRPLPIAVSIQSEKQFNCILKELQLVSVANVSGGVPPYKYDWSNGQVSGSNNEIMTTNANGLVVLTVTDGLGCSASNSFNVELKSPGFNYQLLDCNNRVYQFETINPEALGSNISYLWDFGDGQTSTQSNPKHSFATPGSYDVHLSINTSSCSNTYHRMIIVEKVPELILEQIPELCPGDSVWLHVRGADYYRWENGSTADSILIKTSGAYSVEGTSKAGCKSVLNFNVPYLGLYNYSIQTDRDEVNTDNSELKIWSEQIPSSLYYWDFGDSTSAEGNNIYHNYKVLKDGYFNIKLSVINPNGCKEYATKRVWITPAKIPNVFTPNGDGINDIFMRGWRVKIYNRNGILFYDGSEGWNGTYKDNLVSNDTYFYILYYTSPKGTKTIEGYITVIR